MPKEPAFDWARYRLRERSEGVIVPAGEPVQFSEAVVDELVRYAESLPRRRARILLHGDESALLHEMLIVVPAFALWPPLLNERPPQSWHVLRGSLAFVRYREPGEIVELKKISSTDPSCPTFFRFDERDWYTTVPLEPMTVYMETKPGPHQATKVASWGPQSFESAEGKALVDALATIGCRVPTQSKS